MKNRRDVSSEHLDTMDKMQILGTNTPTGKWDQHRVNICLLPARRAGRSSGRTRGAKRRKEQMRSERNDFKVNELKKKWHVKSMCVCVYTINQDLWSLCNDPWYLFKTAWRTSPTSAGLWGTTSRNYGTSSRTSISCPRTPETFEGFHGWGALKHPEIHFLSLLKDLCNL